MAKSIPNKLTITPKLKDNLLTKMGNASFLPNLDDYQTNDCRIKPRKPRMVSPSKNIDNKKLH